jgi:hypothetical protein
MNVIDIGPLVVPVVIFISAIAKFYWAVKNHSWLAFADGMGRLGLAGFYTSTYLAGLGGNTSGSDEWRALARIGLFAVFSIEAVPWLIGLFRKGGKL